MPNRPSKGKLIYSEWIGTEDELKELIDHVVANELAGPPCWLFLEGPMGAGKSTCARFFLQSLAVEERPAGSPTFPLAHEYPSPHGPVIHMDFYRIQSEEEIEEAGLLHYFLEQDEAFILTEWLAEFPALEKTLQEQLKGKGKVFHWYLDFLNDPQDSRFETHRKLTCFLQ